MIITCKNKAQRVAKWLFLIISLYGFLTFLFNFNDIDILPTQLQMISIGLMSHAVFGSKLQVFACLALMLILTLSVISVFLKNSKIRVCLTSVLLIFCLIDIALFIVQSQHFYSITLVHTLLCCLMDVIYATLLILLTRENLIKIRQGKDKTGDGSLS